MTVPAREAQFSLLPTLETVRKDHVVQRALCRDLEAIADGLPDLPALPELRSLCRRIEQISAQHFERAETVFAGLPGAARPDTEALAMLHQMHQLDEVHAQDIVTILMEQASQPDQRRIGQLSYMLRCFFDGVRRLIALKECWIARAALATPVRSD